MTSYAQVMDCKTVYRVNGKESAYPRLSNDNKRILFQSNASGKWQISVLDIALNQVRSITHDTSNNNFPDWSPDNKLIAFVSNRDGNEEIYLLNTADSSLKRVTNDAGRDIHPYFSPDENYILFNSTRGNGSLDIYRYEIKTGKTLRLTNTPDDETCARYSPDMKHIVYLKNGPAIDDVFTLDISNFLSDNITKTASITDGWPVYSPDGKWIYFSSMESGTYCIYRVRPDGTGKEQITKAKEGEEDARVFISKDGGQMFYNKRKGTTIEIIRCPI